MIVISWPRIRRKLRPVLKFVLFFVLVGAGFAFLRHLLVTRAGQ